MRWLRRWWRRDDRRLIKGANPAPEIDPIEELAHIVGDAQKRDVEDERRYDCAMRASSTRDRRRSRWRVFLRTR
jgi:hypothetical protein